ncbi:hypothetical protein DCAR_0522655 [Daucus carota subsp. sativus]|uniref:Uncharacterized protein n=1 Tax=Daucus carota subsp. sativus TaxID=79200 RepID=A0A175Y996_DAUCS|nr:hypothetical protein DCAR_0522655 [Daucus carota subsp. sativus]
MEKLGIESVIMGAGELGANQVDENIVDELGNKIKSAVEMWDDRVAQYVTSGSKLSPAEMALLDEQIAAGENELNFKKHNEFLKCETNTESEYNSDFDELDDFMLKGTKDQGMDEDVGDGVADDESSPDMVVS